jgi:2-polyprenyl-6-methoxyphenol hydroxylase-like FAD-dependent oxidoreductase
MTSLPSATDVVVVGAGPTGLALAATLADAGVDHVLVDALAEGANTSRATVVHAGTLEALEELKVTDRLVEAGLPAARFVVREGGRRLLATEFGLLPSRYAFALLISQASTEAILLARLRELGGTVHRPYRCATVRQDADAAVVTVVGADGDRHEIRAKYVAGTDGMHSVVREQSGIPYEGSTRSESFLLADVRVDRTPPADEVSLYFGKEGIVVAMPLPGDVVRVVATQETTPEHPTVADVQEVLDTRGPKGGLGTVGEIVWASRFRVHHMLASKYREGRVLLAGDAAHVHSPAGGQGMNTGIVDGLSLGGALAAVLDGAGDEALDAYARRRHEVAEQVVAAANMLVRNAHLPAAVKPLRNVLMRLANRIPAVKTKMAVKFSGLAYR